MLCGCLFWFLCYGYWYLGYFAWVYVVYCVVLLLARLCFAWCGVVVFACCVLVGLVCGFPLRCGLLLVCLNVGCVLVNRLGVIRLLIVEFVGGALYGDLEFCYLLVVLYACV